MWHSSEVGAAQSRHHSQLFRLGLETEGQPPVVAVPTATTGGLGLVVEPVRSQCLVEGRLLRRVRRRMPKRLPVLTAGDQTPSLR